MADPSTQAKDIVDLILRNLRGRRGIRQAFEECDLDIQQEIQETLEYAVEEYLLGQ